tara:strand:- start:89 stop:766 length:678 start_codon:yes stop_codon:yes gene_type:complete
MDTMYNLSQSINLENEYYNILNSLHNELDSLEHDFNSIISFRNKIIFKYIIKTFHNINLFLVLKKYKYYIQNFTFNFINRPRITNKSKLLYTPVAKTTKSSRPCSKRDWAEQIDRHISNKQMMWDDSSTNKSIVGDVFATIFNSDKVDFYIITKILSSNDRLDSWTNNVGQTNRQVLYISSLNYSMKWDQWIDISNYSSSFKCQGTKNAGESTRRNIISHLLENN